MTTQAVHKTVWVTGASSGIGQAIAEYLLQQGHEVVGLARDFSCCTIQHEHFFAQCVDVTDAQALPGVINNLLQRYPQSSALISNAGAGKFGNLEEFSYAQIQSMVQLNLTSHICLARALLPHFKRRGYSHMLFMGSEAALSGGVKGAVYSACKAGLRGLAQSLRKEASRSGVHVTVINPGMVDTDFYRDSSFCPGEHPLEHLQSRDIAEAVAMVLAAREGCVWDELNLSPLKKVIISRS